MLDNYFKYLTQEFGSKNLELLNEKYAYPYEYMNNFDLSEDGTTGGNGEKWNGHITDEEHLTCTKIWNKFNMRINMVIITIVI